MDTRPTPVGHYEILTDFESPAASVRVISLHPQAAVERHEHRRSMQIYVALEGDVEIEQDGVVRALRPYEATAVWPRTVHGARLRSGESGIILNISVPSLAADDQTPSTDFSR